MAATETAAVDALARAMLNDLFGEPRYRLEVERAVSDLDNDARTAFLIGFDLGREAQRRAQEVSAWA